MLTIDEVPSFSIDIERAGDVLFVLDSPVLKDDATKDSSEMLALKAGYREKFINNISQIDNLIEISKVLDEDSAKIDVVFNNLSLLDSLTPLTQTLRNKPEQLQFVYTELSSVSSRQAEVLTSANDLAAEFINQPARLEKLFQEENFANIELIDELVLGDGGFKGNNEQVSLLFNNLDKVTELSRVADQFVGDTRTDILKKMKELSFTYRSDADKRNIIFANPEQISALHDLLTRSYISADLDRVDIVLPMPIGQMLFLQSWMISVGKTVQVASKSSSLTQIILFRIRGSLSLNQSTIPNIMQFLISMWIRQRK